MIDEPGSFSGSEFRRGRNAGPTQQADVVGDLDHAGGQAFSAPCVNTSASLEASASNLFGAVMKGRAVSSATFSANRSANPGCALSPVPTAVPPCARA